MIKKILSVLLLAAVLSLAALVTGCGNDDVYTSDTPATTQADGETPGDDEQTGPRAYASSAEVFDWNGRDFRVLVNYEGNPEWRDVDWTSEEILGEPINDAVFRRNSEIEQMFNINIVPVPSGDRPSDIRRNVTAGDDAFDIAFVHPHGQSVLSQEGLLWDLFQVPNLNLEQPWWDQNAVVDLSIANRLYAMVGDIGTMYRMSVGILLFNKQMHADHALDDPYQLVAENRWTLDAFAQMATQVSADLDGSGVWDDETSRFGILGYADIMTIGMLGAGVRFATKNDDDIPEITFMEEHTISVFNKIFSLLEDEQVYWSWSRADSTNERSRAMFANNQGLFNWNEFHSIPRLRAMETDFGILPMPLYDERQERYFHHVNPHVAPMFVIPISTYNIAEVGAISDHLAALGRNILTPAYYEISLQGQHARDEESVATMSLIFNTLTFDIGYMNNWADIGTFTMGMGDQRVSDIVSRYERLSDRAQTQLDRMVERFLELD